MTGERAPQDRYSELQPLMGHEAHRRHKAQKILAVIRHFLGRPDLAGLRVLDLGCSYGFISDEIAAAGATVEGLDIDDAAVDQARERFGHRVAFATYDGSELPFEDRSFDIVVFNHIYEHSTDPDRLVAEVRRVLAPTGLAYLGLGNRYGIIEPHYKLPFLSWLPERAADRYIRAAGRAGSYYERFRSRRGLLRLCRDFDLWEYTYTVLGDPALFHTTEMVRGPLRRIPSPAWRLAQPVIPTFIWVGVLDGRQPAGPPTNEPPRRLVAP